MRLWSLHPEYLDTKGLLALWREGLLAQAVLCGNTSGYQRHPQLQRFQQKRDPIACICTYLWAVHRESQCRRYNFDSTRIVRSSGRHRMRVTHGQIEFEFEHLKRKLKLRDPRAWKQLQKVTIPRPHPMFDLMEGDIEEWERP